MTPDSLDLWYTPWNTISGARERSIARAQLTNANQKQSSNSKNVAINLEQPALRTKRQGCEGILKAMKSYKATG